MRYDDFEVKTFNDETVVRVTHKDSGIYRESDDVTKDGATKLMHDIIDEIEKKKRPCSFATALNAVVSEGKGMHVAGDTAVVRAQYPDEYSMMELPYLFIETEVGTHPWSIDSCAPFATWVVIE